MVTGSSDLQDVDREYFFTKSIVHYASEVIKIVQFDNILLKQIYRLYFMSQQMNCDTLLTIFVSKLMWFKLW